MTAQPRGAVGFGRRTNGARAFALPRAGWTGVGLLALLCSGVGWASLPKSNDIRADERLQWQALGIAPLANGGTSGGRMDATAAVEPVAVIPLRKIQPVPVAVLKPKPAAGGPLRIRGRVG
ncbi:MAG: hypothetical protein ACJ8EQ_10385, partial [Sphingomicrobium sp.]